MKNCSINARHETSEHELDARGEFSQLLDDARQAKEQVNLETSSRHLEKVGKKGLGEENKKSKKSWKTFLFSWRKADRKSKTSVEPANYAGFSNSRRARVSGPIYGSGRGVDNTRNNSPASGPLTSLFNPAKRAEHEIAYMCLDRHNSSRDTKAFGPIYFL